MVGSLVRFVARLIPEEYRPEFRRFQRFASQAIKAAKRGRTPVKAARVVWLRTEVADIESFLLPRPGPGEILIEMDATLISPGTERAFLVGMPNTSQTFPSGAGYSAAGRVVAVGRRVQAWVPGQRAAGVAPHTSHAVVVADRVVPIPDSVTSEVAAFTQLGAIALHGIRRGSISPGEKVAVIGLGIIGQLTVQLARWAGAVPIVGMARSRGFEGYAWKSGCDEVVDLSSHPDAPDQLQADVVFEATGNPDAIHTACRSARDGGRVVLVGSTRGLTGPLDFDSWIGSRGITLIGAHISGVAKRESSPGRWTQRDESELFLDLVDSGHVDPAHLIDELVDPSEANSVYERLVARRTPIMGLVFDWKRAKGGRGMATR